MTDEITPSDEAIRARLEKEGAEGLGQVFDQYRDRLRGAVNLRIDPRMKGRVDPSDVIQEAFIEAQKRLPDYLQDSKLAPYVWIRYLAMQRLMILHRHHLEAKQRDARRELSIDRHVSPEASSLNLASWILDSKSTPGRAIQRAEQQIKLQQALEKMAPLDREVLALRHFEQLNNPEAAAVMGQTPGATSQRYYRALKKLKEILVGLFDDISNQE